MKQPKRYLITAALPYANGLKHIGHLAGAYLPADIYVRYLRAQKREVVFVCGSDESELSGMGKRFDLVHVVWDDATDLDLGWKDSEDLKPEEEHITSVGFLVKETESHIVLASCVSKDGFHNGHFQIPRALIVKLKKLRVTL